QRRRPHAGGHLLPDADGEVLRGAGPFPPRAEAVHQRAARSHHRRRGRLLRLSRRRDPGRAARADRLRRAAGDRADHPAEAPRRIPDQRVPAQARDGGRDRPPQGDARPPGAAPRPVVLKRHPRPGPPMDFAELKQLLFARGNFGVKLGLERMREACALLGNPERGAPVLHVAGTNGKGSTCAFAEAALRAAGLRTGLYTSPHLFHFCERIRVAGEPVAEQYAADLLEEMVRRVPWALRDDGLTFFELATAMAFLAFARERVQVAVVEVGLGGRLDATNVVEPLACAVAPIGLDHVQWLGPTLSHVAAEKAGILKKGVPAVSAGQSRAAADVLAQRAAELAIPLWRPGRDYVYESRDVRPFCYEGRDEFSVSLGETKEVARRT